MDKEKPYHLLQGLIHLDCLNLEEKLLNSQLNNPLLLGGIYFIDLSQVRFIELNAATQLLLIIESYLKREASIYIALPTTIFVEKEISSKNLELTLGENILHSRKKSNNFIKTIGFVKALQEITKIYSQETYITETYNFESEFNLQAFKNAFSIIYETHDTEYHNYNYIFPFEWIKCNNGLEDFSTIEKKIDKILENKERGLDPIDVKGIKNVIFSELIKNVVEHSETEYALFTIGLISTINLVKESRLKKDNEVESKYLQ